MNNNDIDTIPQILMCYPRLTWWFDLCSFVDFIDDMCLLDDQCDCIMNLSINAHRMKGILLIRYRMNNRTIEKWDNIDRWSFSVSLCEQDLSFAFNCMIFFFSFIYYFCEWLVRKLIFHLFKTIENLKLIKVICNAD